MRISDWSSDVCSSDLDPGTRIRQIHEAQIMAASEQRRRLVGNAGDAVKLLEDAGDNQRQTEGQEQSVEMVEMVEQPYQQALQHDADRADDDWSEQQGPPIADAEIGQQHPGGESDQPVRRAMSAVHDFEPAENEPHYK